MVKAESIAECPDLESLWNIGKLEPVTRQIQLSHSDIGPYIHFVCPEEHHVVGPAMVTCLKGGIWDDVTEPYCSSSSLYGIPQSDSILIGVLAGSGAIIIITLTVILTHLFCLRSSRMRKATSNDGLHRSDESFPSTTYYVDDKSYCSISAPTCPTMNGRPLQTVTRGQRPPHLATSTAPSNNSQKNQHFDNASNHLITQAYYYEGQEDGTAHAPRVNGHVTTIADENVFVNHGFSQELSNMYSSHWEQMQAPSPHNNTFQMSTYPSTSENNRTPSSGSGTFTHNTTGHTPNSNLYSTVNRTVL